MYRGYTKMASKRTFLGVLLILVILGCTAYLGFRLFLGHSVRSAALKSQSQSAAPPQGLIAFEEGTHYQRIKPELLAHENIQALIAENPGKIQVIEFFNYGCFWCGRLHPVLDSWAAQQSPKIAFLRFPVVFNKQWNTLAKAYYVVKTLNLTTRLDSVFFKAIHQDHIDLADEKRLSAFFVEQGVSEKEFSDLYGSFIINAALTKATAISNAYQISASPVIVINAPSGSYLLNAQMAGGEKALIQVLDHVIARESKAADTPLQ